MAETAVSEGWTVGEGRGAGVPRDAPETPEGYRRTEVGVIPEDWETKPLGRICSMKSGESITSADIDDTSRFPCHGGNGFRGFTNRFTHSGRFALIGRQGALCGNVVGVSGRFFASEHAIVVTAHRQTDIGWLTYVLREMRLNQYSESSAQPGLSVAKLLLLDAACPPTKAEQRAIAAVLMNVDALLGSLEALIAKKRAVKQAAMQQLLTGRTRLPGFGGAWETRRLGELGTFRKGKGIRRNELREVGALCIRYGELYTQYENYVVNPVSRIPEDVAATSLRIEKGELLFAGSGETAEEIGICVAYIGAEPAYAGGDIIVLRLAGQDPVYLSHLLNAPAAARQKARMAQGDAVVHIRADHLAEIQLPLPPLPEQRAIAAVLSDMDSEIAALERRFDKTRALKKGMMQQLLTGAIRLPIPKAAAENEPGG